MANTTASQLKTQAKRVASARKKQVTGVAHAKKVPGIKMRKLRIRA
jgi:hypothetical protein